MKDKILFLVTGILIGAMVATGVFMVINKNNSNNNQNNFDRQNFRNFDPDNMPEGFELPEDFDPNNLPEGFDPSNRPNGGQRRNNSNTTTDSI